MQLGDVVESYANIDLSSKMLDFEPATSINDGIPRFINWFKNYKGFKKWFFIQPGDIKHKEPQM